MLKGSWLAMDEKPANPWEYVFTFKTQLMEVGKLAKKNLCWGQIPMKVWYDQNATGQTFDVGDKVLDYQLQVIPYKLNIMVHTLLNINLMM